MRILILICFFPIYLMAQEDLKINWSEKMIENSIFKDVIEFQGHYYLLRNHNSGAVIQNKDKTSIRKFDQNLKLLQEEKFNTIVNGKKSVAFQLLKTKEKLLLVSIANTQNEQVLSISEINSDLSISDGSIISLKIDGAHSIFKKGRRYFINQSNNNLFTSICIHQQSRSDTNSKYQFILFDETMKKVREGTFEIPDSKSKRILKQVAVSNTGDIAGVSLRKFQSVKRKVYAWKYHYATDQSIVEEIKQESDKTIVDISIGIRGDEFLISGGYSNNPDKEYPSKIRGVFSTILNVKTQIIPNIIYTPLTPKVLHTCMSPNNQKRATKKGKVKEFLGFVLGDTFLWKDDFIIIQGEGHSSVHRQGEGTTNYHNCGMVICLNRAGELVWEIPVIKRHERENYYAIHGQKVIVTPKEILVIFNNFRGEVFGQKPLFPIAESSLITRIDEDGNANTKVFAQKYVYSVLACPKWIKQINDEQIFIYGSGLFPTRLGILNIK